MTSKMKKGSSTRSGKGRFHPSRISGHEKFARMREANKQIPRRIKTPLFDSVKETSENKPTNA